MSDTWIFSYGSLMWHPGFAYEEAVHARVSGYHRALCVKSIVYRGTPKKPGLVLGLDAGGACHGIAYRISSTNACKTRAYLRARELVTNVYIETQRSVVLLDGSARKVNAMCFIVNRTHPQYQGRLSLQQQACRLQKCAGRSGPNIEYFLNTLRHLRQISIHDVNLERLAVVMGALQMRRRQLYS